jgi:hypothetical protein
MREKFMGVAHLEGKRTGRRKGSKTAPEWLRGLRWAIKNFGKVAVPPTPAAAKWQAIAYEQPDRFMKCWAQYEDMQRDEKKDANGSIPKGPERREEAGAVGVRMGEKPMRARSVFLPVAKLRPHIRLDRNALELQNFPLDIRVIRCVLDPARGGLVIALSSAAFEEVPANHMVPELPPVLNGQ